MKFQVLAIFDSASKAYSHPFFELTLERAQGSFRATCEDSRTKLAQYPKDFSLWHLGEYDDALGRFANLDAPVMVATAMTVAPQAAAPVASISRLSETSVSEVAQ